VKHRGKRKRKRKSKSRIIFNPSFFPCGNSTRKGRGEKETLLMLFAGKKKKKKKVGGGGEESHSSLSLKNTFTLMKGKREKNSALARRARGGRKKETLLSLSIHETPKRGRRSGSCRNPSEKKTEKKGEGKDLLRPAAISPKKKEKEKGKRRNHCRMQNQEVECKGCEKRGRSFRFNRLPGAPRWYGGKKKERGGGVS